MVEKLNLKNLEARVSELERRHNMTDGEKRFVVAGIIVVCIIFLIGLFTFFKFILQ